MGALFLGLAGVACGDGASSAPSVAQPVLEQPSATQQVPTETPPPTDTPPTEAPASPTDTPAGPPPGAAHPDLGGSGCAAVATESHYCLTLGAGAIHAVGLDSGSLCSIAATSAPLSSFTLPHSSIAWMGDHVFVCSEDGLLRIALADGSWEIGGAACNGVTNFDGGLLVDRYWAELLLGTYQPSLTWYSSYEAVLEGAPERAYDVGGSGWAIATHIDRLYTAWHAGSSLEVDSLTENVALGVLTLESFDDWIGGLSITPDGRLALIGGILGDSIFVFDVRDGRLLGRRDLDESLFGLACFANDSHVPGATPSPTPTAPSNVTMVPTATPCSAGFDCPARCPDADAAPPLALHELPPSSDGTTSCRGGRPSSNYALEAGLSDPTATEELHVIGVYEGAGDPGFGPERRGVVDVLVRSRPKPVVLALSSYGKTHWRITVAPGAELSRVLVQGFGEQTVEGVPESAPVFQIEACSYTYGWEVEHNEGGGGHQTVIAQLRAITGLRESSFQGCYDGVQFEVPHWSGDPPLERPTPIAGDETLAPHEIELAGCDAVVSQSQYCLTTTMDGIAAVGLDTGEMCSVTATTAPLTHGYTTSYAWRGELLYACTNEGLVRVSLLDGSWERAQVACDAVAGNEDGIFLLPRIGPLRRYSDYQAVLDREPDRIYSFDLWGTRIAVEGARIYDAWHATDTIEIHDLAGDAAVGPLVLEDYDGWIMGLAVTDDSRLVLTDGFDRIVLFDVDSGAQLGELALPEFPIFGLACTAAPGAA